MVREAKVKRIRKTALRIEYEPEVDVLVVHVKDRQTPLSHSSEAKEGVVLNYTADGSLASVEILDASQRYPAGQLAACSVDEFIDLATASQLSGKAPVTLKAQAEKGKLWAIKLGTRWMTTRERLQHYLDSRARKKAEIG
jgi:uncharacterized protein YuzE